MSKVFVPQMGQIRREGKEYTCILAVEYINGEGTCKGCSLMKDDKCSDTNLACESSERSDGESVIFVLTGDEQDA